MNANKGGAASAANGNGGSGRDWQRDGDGEGMLPQLDDMLAPGDFGQLGDLGNEGDDCDGGPDVAKAGAASIAARKSSTLWSFDRSIECMRALARIKRSEEGRVPDDVWRRLADEALGLSNAKGGAGEATGAPSNPVPLESVEDGLCDIKRGLALLHEIALLQSQLDGEIATAKQHIDNAAKSAKSIARVSIRFGLKRPV